MYSIVKADPSNIVPLQSGPSSITTSDYERGISPVAEFFMDSRPIDRLNLGRYGRISDAKSQEFASRMYGDVWESVYEFHTFRQSSRGDDDQGPGFYKKARNAEHTICNFLSSALMAESEVVNRAGRIDLLTANSLIEVKVIQHWKHGLGQVLAYSEYVERPQNVLILFGVDRAVDRTVIDSICQKYGITTDYSFVFSN